MLAHGATWIAAIFLTGGWAVNGAAAPAQGRGPCADDVARLCGTVQPGGGRIARCLKQREQELSPACGQHLVSVTMRAHEIRQACDDDVLRFCWYVKPGGGRVLHCLKEHERELSADCRASVHQKRDAKGK